MRFLLSTAVFLFGIFTYGTSSPVSTSSVANTAPSSLSIKNNNSSSGYTFLFAGMTANDSMECQGGCSSNCANPCTFGGSTVSNPSPSCLCSLAPTGVQWISIEEGGTMTITYSAQGPAPDYSYGGTASINFSYSSSTGNVSAYITSDSDAGFALNGVTGYGTGNTVTNPTGYGFLLTFNPS